MEYLRVFPPYLNREKRWYIFYSKLPLLKPSKFTKRVVFENFPDEVRKIRASLLTTEDGQPLTSTTWFKSKYKANSTQDQEVNLTTSFGLYIGTLNHKNTFDVSKEYDFFRTLLNSFCLDDVRAKTAKMPANFSAASAGEVSALPSLKFAYLESGKEQIAQQDKFIENLQRNLEENRAKNCWNAR